MCFIIDDDADVATFVLHENVTVSERSETRSLRVFCFHPCGRLTPRPHYQAVTSLCVCGSGRSFLSH